MFLKVLNQLFDYYNRISKDVGYQFNKIKFNMIYKYVGFVKN